MEVTQVNESGHWWEAVLFIANLGIEKEVENPLTRAGPAWVDELLYDGGPADSPNF